MFQALFDFFLSLFYLEFPNEDTLGDAFVQVGGFIGPNNGLLTNHITITLPEYLSLICSLISLVFIVVLCCLFIWKIVKLVGGLIR